VEQRAVDDRPESAVIAGEIIDVGDLESRRRDPASGGFGAGQLDAGRCDIQAHGGVSTFGQIQRERGFPAAGVEHLAVDLARLDERGDLRLRLSDAPRRANPVELRVITAVSRLEYFVERCAHGFLLR